MNESNLYAIKANTEKEIEQLSLAILEKYKQIRDKEAKLKLIQQKIWEEADNEKDKEERKDMGTN